jgi:hypothetical protein
MVIANVACGLIKDYGKIVNSETKKLVRPPFHSDRPA